MADSSQRGTRITLLITTAIGVLMMVAMVALMFTLPRGEQPTPSVSPTASATR